MHEIHVILRDQDEKPIEVLGNPVVVLENESVMWHFTSFRDDATHAEVTFLDDEAKFFKDNKQPGATDGPLRRVDLRNGRGHAVGVVPVTPATRSLAQKYTVKFFFDPQVKRDPIELDPEIIVGKP